MMVVMIETCSYVKIKEMSDYVRRRKRPFVTNTKFIRLTLYTDNMTEK